MAKKKKRTNESLKKEFENWRARRMKHPKKRKSKKKSDKKR